jgi:putative SOS response-associated peptidase YedK
MPAILAPGDFAGWLDPRAAPADLQGLRRPYPEGEMVAEAVGAYVSNPRNEGPRCLAP